MSEASKKYYHNHLEEERERGRVKYHRLYKNRKGRQKQSPSDVAYRLKYPEKYAAGKAIRNWKRKDGIDFHHWSYQKDHYKDVIELVKADHYKAHRFLVYDQTHMLYRTLDGVLLSTKETHHQYILTKIENAT